MHLPRKKIIISITILSSPGGGIGRRKGLKIPRGQPRAGSTPALGIIYEEIINHIYSVIHCRLL